MLVDLARNDMGRVSKIGSVKVTELKQIHYYSHVMHIVSLVEGEKREDKDCFDVLSTFLPAGTLSGAPKIRAMEIIEELEEEKRGLYGGSIGYFSFNGNMDMCIAIRTMIIKDKKIYMQAGAGIVADSIPKNEYEERCGTAVGSPRTGGHHLYRSHPPEPSYKQSGEQCDKVHLRRKYPYRLPACLLRSCKDICGRYRNRHGQRSN